MTDHPLSAWERGPLATLVRELLLCGHLIDRATMPHVIGAWGREEMRDIAIDEWMGASPIYARRMQRLLGFVGTDVATIFKGMQFDIGAPPQFMDFRYTVDDADHGAFHLDHCGALMDVEPMGEEYVVTMCHDIEDPTFDATACATNPRARMRPIHRPPRTPADREPHCAWTVTIEPDAAPLAEPEMAVLMADTVIAGLPLPSIEADDPGDTGRRDYAGPLVDDVDFDGFSAGTLIAIAEEVALQGQLLSLSGLTSIAGRHGDAAAQEVGWHQLIGWSGATAARLVRAFEFGPTLADAARLLSIHPAFRPRSYIDLRVTELPGDRLHVALHPCPALDDPSGLTWPALCATHPGAEPISAIVHAVDPRLGATRTEPTDGAVAAYEVTRADAPASPDPDVGLVDFSTGMGFRFQDPGTRVQLRRTRRT